MVKSVLCVYFLYCRNDKQKYSDSSQKTVSRKAQKDEGQKKGKPKK